MADLEDVQTVDLMSELLRRLKCAQKPDRRLIFIGMSSIGPFFLLLSPGDDEIWSLFGVMSLDPGFVLCLIVFPWRIILYLG